MPGAFVADGLSDIGIVDLEDGIRLMCRLLVEPWPPEPDAAVEMVTLLYEDGPLFAARALSVASA